MENRSVTYQERPVLAGLEVSQGALQTINLPGGGTAQARQVNVFGDGTDFDFEVQSAYAVNILAEADTDTIAGTIYEAHTALLPLALTITDVFEPTAAPSLLLLMLRLICQRKRTAA